MHHVHIPQSYESTAMSDRRARIELALLIYDGSIFDLNWNYPYILLWGHSGLRERGVPVRVAFLYAIRPFCFSRVPCSTFA